MSSQKDFVKVVDAVNRLSQLVLGLVLFTLALLVLYKFNPDFLKETSEPPPPREITVDDDPNLIKDGIHVRTGLIDAEGLMTVVINCTGCHSAKLITQNRMNAERWNKTIDWMQRTQNLGDLGENREVIINYLTTNYPVKIKGRRENLQNIEWYVLED